MADISFHDRFSDGTPPPDFVKGGEKARKGKISRFGHFLAGVATSKKTHDFVIGAAVSGSISAATRMGVLAAAGTMGVGLLPASLIAAGTAGAAVGSYRLYRDYKTEKAAGTWTGFDFKKARNKLLVSTAFSTFGGGMTYIVINHGDVAIRAFDTIKTYAADMINSYFPGSTDLIASKSEKVVASGAAVFAALTNIEWVSKFDSSVETVKKALSGWGASFKTMLGNIKLSQISIPETQTLTPPTSEAVLTEVKLPKADTVIVLPEPSKLTLPTSQDVLPDMDTIKAEPVVAPEACMNGSGEENVCVKAIDDLANPVETDSPVGAASAGPIVASASIDIEDVQVAVAGMLDQIKIDTSFFGKAFDAVQSAQVMAVSDVVPSAPEVEVLPRAAFEQSSLPAVPSYFEHLYAPQDVSAPKIPEVGAGVAEVIATPVEMPPVTFADKFSNAFDGVDLSNRAERAFEAALNGTDQQRKDLAMHILNGQAGFEKNPELAASLYQFLLEDTKPLAGEKPSQTHLQVVRDTAYLMFHGKGVEADPEAAKALLEEIAPRSKVARSMLAEWNGEKVRHVATAAVKETAARSAGGAGALNCEWISAGKKILAGSCEFKGDLSLKVGDKIVLTP